MEKTDISFTVEKDINGRVSGFSLTASGNEKAEAFCVSFPRARELDKANITFEEGKIVFTHHGISAEEAKSYLKNLGFSAGGKFSVAIDSPEGALLSNLLKGEGPYAGYEIGVRYIKTCKERGCAFFLCKRLGRVILVNPSGDTAENCPAMNPSAHYSSNQPGPKVKFNLAAKYRRDLEAEEAKKKK